MSCVWLGLDASGVYPWLSIKVTLSGRVGLLGVWERSFQIVFQIISPCPLTNRSTGRNECTGEVKRGFRVVPWSRCEFVNLFGSVKWSLDPSQVNLSFPGIEFGATSELGLKRVSVKGRIKQQPFLLPFFFHFVECAFENWKNESFWFEVLFGSSPLNETGLGARVNASGIEVKNGGQFISRPPPPHRGPSPYVSL